MAPYIRFAARYHPEILAGTQPIRPTNMQDGEDRLRYLDGLLSFLKLWTVVRGGADEQQREKLLAQIPLASALIEWPAGQERFRERPGIRQSLSFREDALSVALLDGYQHDNVSLYQTGVDTPHVAALLSRVVSGARRDELVAWGRELPIDVEGLLESFAEDGVLEEFDPGTVRVAERFTAPGRDRLTWLGHAGFLFQSGPTHVWVDPFLSARMRWTPEQAQALFSRDHADSVLMDPYGPEVPNLTVHDLPTPDVVCITHQDVDHLRLGLLATLPAKVPIVVPRSTGNPWDVDIPRLLRRMLGPERAIVPLAHGETFRVGSVDILAFPFRGEFPTVLPHGWNCYLLQTEHSAVACTADSRLTDADVDILARTIHPSGKPLTLLAQAPEAPETTPGYRDQLDELFSLTRLWAWYVPTLELFTETQFSCLTYDKLARMRAAVNLAHFFPCARGSCPQYRLPPSSPFFIGIGHMSRADLHALDEGLGRIGGVGLFPGRYGRPTPTSASP
ncbi:MBL fold metallo-hydrolase [Archangium sp.]|uniref:MBL fold metallo-hydrolase n=1 Tax=Archangium sp. TaxID=1872627 RepID=UPI002D327E8C|nr:MBL fold metallo-hydrolase [Archangium sp.]HYO58441.1 MBL fold metallo-hydrolase [Archangium sp.]